MNLLFLVDNITGGGGYSLFKFAEYLSKLDHNVFVCTSRHPAFFAGGYEQRLPRSLHIIMRFRIPWLARGFGLLDRIWRRIYDRSFLEGFINREQINWIFGMQHSDAIRAVDLGRRANVRIGNFVFESPKYVCKRLRLGADQSVRTFRTWEAFGKALLGSDIVLATSQTTKAEVEDWLALSDVKVVYPGIDTDEVDKVPSSQQDYQIVYIGRLVSSKNVQEILCALGQTPNPPKLVICGDGPERRSLEHLVTDLKVPCVFRGWISEWEKWQEIKRSLFMVFPSSLEGFGIPPGEALCCGVPCVVSDIPVMREVYGDYVEYFEEHNIQHLAQVMSKLLTDPGYRTERGRLGCQHIKSKYSWRESAAKIHRIITSSS